MTIETNKDTAAEGLLASYFEKAKQAATWSGLPLRESYGPADRRDADYAKEVGDPGEYPFTRGVHRNMYRGRYWTKREVCGLGSPKDTNERMRYLAEEGGGGLNPIVDHACFLGLDADHPLAVEEVGVTGVHICCLPDMEALTEGIPLDKVSMSLIAASCVAPLILAQYLVVAEQRGIDQACLRGTIQNDPIHMRYCGARPAVPTDLALKTAVDTIEYSARHLPYWNPTTVNLYDLREQGITAAQEIAFAFGIAQLYVDGTLERGLKIDDFAPRLAFYVSAHIDFFEEIAKMRAARRIWAQLMKEKYGAQDPRSMKFRFAVHTAGCSLVPQQPLNNVIRIAYEALAAVLGGVQSLHCCAYDEPIALPSEEAHRLALRTQQILSYETGVAGVADPLGGSYYIEALTDRLEEATRRVMQQVEEQGGMLAALNSGWLDREMEKAALERQRELECGEKIIVGVNAYVTEQEKETPGGVQRIPRQSCAEQVAAVARLRRERDQAAVRRAIDHLRAEIDKGPKHNLIPAIQQCVKAYATNGEILGTIRMAYGHSYDPLGILQPAF